MNPNEEGSDNRNRGGYGTRGGGGASCPDEQWRGVMYYGNCAVCCRGEGAIDWNLACSPDTEACDALSSDEIDA